MWLKAFHRIYFWPKFHQNVEIDCTLQQLSISIFKKILGLFLAEMKGGRSVWASLSARESNYVGMSSRLSLSHPSLSGPCLMCTMLFVHRVSCTMISRWGYIYVRGVEGWILLSVGWIFGSWYLVLMCAMLIFIAQASMAFLYLKSSSCTTWSLANQGRSK